MLPGIEDLLQVFADRLALLGDCSQAGKTEVK
jgi:hypothetical protein